MTTAHLAWYEWLAEVGTNMWVGSFLNNNSLIILGAGAFIFTVLKIIAKRTKSPEDDKIVAELESLFNDKIGSLIRKTKFKNA